MMDKVCADNYAATLLAHMEDRMHARHASPSRFVHGDLDAIRTLIQGVPATKLRFAVVGVQPGIRRSLVDAIWLT